MKLSFTDKILDPAGICKWAEARKSNHQKIVFTNGCFDLLHLGHLSYLQDARSKGDLLLVALNSDESVKRLKGDSRPVNALRTRLAVMASLFFVDAVTWFEEDTPYELIRKIIPNVLVKGGDWGKDEIVGSDIVSENGGEVLSLDYQQGHSTTELIQKIIGFSSSP